MNLCQSVLEIHEKDRYLMLKTFGWKSKLSWIHERGRPDWSKIST